MSFRLSRESAPLPVRWRDQNAVQLFWRTWLGRSMLKLLATAVLPLGVVRFDKAILVASRVLFRQFMCDRAWLCCNCSWERVFFVCLPWFCCCCCSWEESFFFVCVPSRLLWCVPFGGSPSWVRGNRFGAPFFVSLPSAPSAFSLFYDVNLVNYSRF